MVSLWRMVELILQDGSPSANQPCHSTENGVLFILVIRILRLFIDIAKIDVNLQTGVFLVRQLKRTWHGTFVSMAVNRCSPPALCHAAGKPACLELRAVVSTSTRRLKRRPVTQNAFCTGSSRSAANTNTCPVSTTIASICAVRFVK